MKSNRLTQKAQQLLSLSIDRLDRDVAELDGVTVSGEAEEAGGSVFAGVGAIGHVGGDLADIGVEDHIAIQFDLDG